jgi:hypothetical protein
MLNNLGKISQETIELTKSSMDLAKAITTTTGIVGYNLEAPAKQLIPFLAPLRNRIPRIVSKTGTAVHWKVITAVTPNGRVTSTEGTRGSSVSTTLVDMLASFKTLGLQDSVTFESLAAGRNFQDVKATAVTNLLLRVMTEEEKQILFGMTSQALSVPSAMATSVQATGGTLGDATSVSYYVGVAALTGNGVNRNVPRSAPASVAFDMNDGNTVVTFASATADTGGGGATFALYLSVPPVYGALGYAWFVGTASSAAATYQITTTTNRILLTSAVTGVTTASSVTSNGDTTQDTYAYDGLLAQALWPQTGATGAYFNDLAGAKLTKDNGGISEIDAALQYIFDTWKISPTRILCGAGVQKDITKGIVSGYGAPTLFVNNSEKNAITGNYLAESYINSVYGGRPIPMETHPWLPAGCVIGITEVVPFPNANVPSVFEMELGYDYMQLEYAVVQPKYEFEVRNYGCLKSYFPGGQFVLTNVGSGIQ